MEEARDCGGKYGGGAFRNRLAAANEATKNKKIKYVAALNGYKKS
jgi:hypothetical protein